MKHVLPLLTLALLGAAATAFADNFYYDYYLDPGQSAPQKVTVGEQIYDPWYDTDTYTYGGSETDVKGDFSVARNSNWYSALNESAKSNFFRIEVNKDNVELYLTDFVKGLYEDTMQFNSTSNALFNMDIKEYGYRTLTWDENAGKYVASNETVVKEIFDADGNLNKENVSAIDSITKGNNEEVVRYKYALGTFSKDTVLEIYMRDTSDREVYSFSSPEGDDFVPFDNTVPKQIDTLPGGFGDGGYLVNPIEIDDMLDSYYFPDREEHEPFDPEKTPAAGKAMPLSQLIPTGGQPVAFGIIAMTDGVIGGGNGGNGGSGTMGQPLPGGLQIALIAGLFGLGFWFIRRRKATAA